MDLTEYRAGGNEQERIDALLELVPEDASHCLEPVRTLSFERML